MRVLWFALLAACGFDARVAGMSPPETVDAALAIDAPPDAPDPVQLPACAVGTMSTTGTDRGRVGGGGGGDNFPPLKCDGDDRIVGAAFRISNHNTLYNGRSAVAMQIACAPVSIAANGTGVIGNVTMKEVSGSGAEGWSPSTLTPVTMCPAGQVMNGLQAHTGPNTNLFVNITIRCGAIDHAALTTGNQAIYVNGTLTETQGSDTVNCNANEILVQLSNRTGSGLDSVNLFCSPAKCI